MNKTPDQHDPDWPRYSETVLTFATHRRLEIDLREIPSDSALSKLRAAGLGDPFAIVTAFGSEGRNLSASENAQRKTELDRRLTATGHHFVHVDCCSPDRSHCECSVAVTMPQQKALDLARELRQVAIFWLDGNRFWVLCALVHA